MDAGAIIVIGEGADAAAADFGLDGVEHRRPADFEHLARKGVAQAIQFEWPGRKGDLHQVFILLGLVDALPVEQTQPERAIIAEQFLPVIGQPVPDFLDRWRRIIGHDAQVAFARHGAVDAVAAIERQAVGRGLHILPAIGHLRLAEPQPDALGLVEEDVGIGVAQLAETLPALATTLVADGGREIRLQIERYAIRDIALQDEADPAQGKAALVGNATVMDRAQARNPGRRAIVAGQEGVVAHLGIAAQRQAIIPVFLGLCGRVGIDRVGAGCRKARHLRRRGRVGRNRRRGGGGRGRRGRLTGGQGGGKGLHLGLQLIDLALQLLDCLRLRGLGHQRQQADRQTHADMSRLFHSLVPCSTRAPAMAVQ